MNRPSTVLCLSLSIVAVGLASFALFQSAPRRARTDNGVGEDRLRELRLEMTSLRERVEAVEANEENTPNREVRSPGGRMPRREPRSASEPADDLQRQIAELTRRLASLEDGETIARLAQSGEEQAIRRELGGAIGDIEDARASPEARFEALMSIRRLGKTHGSLVARAMKESGLEERDLVLPMLELAQDTTLASDFRAEVVRNLQSKAPELRQPLLDLLAFDEAPEVREGTIDALMYHLGDSAVREAITQASREDRDEAVRARAEKYLPKVQHFDRMATEAERAAAGKGK